MRPGFAVAALAIALTLGACSRSADGPWMKPDGSETAQKRQTAACRAEAREYVDREMAVQPAERDLIRPQDSQSVQGAFTRLDLGRIYDRVFDNCMRAAGYSRGAP